LFQERKKVDLGLFLPSNRKFCRSETSLKGARLKRPCALQWHGLNRRAYQRASKEGPYGLYWEYSRAHVDFHEKGSPSLK